VHSLGVVLLFGFVPAVSLCAAPRETDAVSFVRDLAPVLQQKCVACHGPEKQQGGYRVDSLERLMKPGDSEEAPVAAGDPARSHLMQLLTAADEDDRMPQKDDPLPATVVAKFRRWIEDGAQFDGPNPKQSLADLIPRPSHPTPPEGYRHSIPVLSLSLLDEGRLVAIGGYHEVLIRDIDSGALRQRLTNLPERIHALRPVNGGRQLAYAGGYPGRSGEAGLIELGSAESRATPRVLARAADTILALAISPDGKQLAAGGADKIIRVIEVTSGREVRQLSQHADWVMGLAFNLDGTRLASASRDGTARVFDPATGEMLCAFREHEAPVFDVSFVGEGKELVSSGRDGRVRFWTADKGEQRASLKDLGGPVYSLAVRGNTLLASVADGSVHEIVASEHRLGARGSVRAGVALLKVAADAQGKLVVVGGEDGSIAVFEPGATQPRNQFLAWPMAVLSP